MKMFKKVIGLVKRVVEGLKGLAKCSFKLEGRCIEKGFCLSAEVKAEVEISSLDSTDKDLPNSKETH